MPEVSLISVSVVSAIVLRWPVVIILMVSLFVETAASECVTDGKRHTKEHNHCSKRLEENPKDVDIVDFHHLSRALCKASIIFGLAVVLACVFFSHSLKFQASSIWVYAVGGVDEPGTRFGVMWQLFVIVEPAVLRCREALILQTAQLSGCPDSDCLGHTAAGNYGFHSYSQTDQDLIKVPLVINSRHLAAVLSRVGPRRVEDQNVGWLSELGPVLQVACYLVLKVDVTWHTVFNLFPFDSWVVCRNGLY